MTTKRKMYAGLASQLDPDTLKFTGWWQIWLEGKPYLRSRNLPQLVKILNTYNAKEARGEFDTSPLILP